MNNKKIKRVFCAVITTVCLCLSACGGNGNASDTTANNSGNNAGTSAKGVKAIFSVSDISDTFRTNLAEAAKNAAEMLNVFFKTGQPIDAVICNNDNMALGAVEAVKSNGKSLSEVPVLGIDATADGLASIAAGEMECTVFQSAAGQGEAAVIAAAQIVSGKSITTLEGAEANGLYMWVPFELVTKDNYTQY